jgi:hypothetical protein
MIGKIIVIVAIVAAIAGDLSIATPIQKAYAASGYSKGYADAVCDLQSCHGHGYDPSCPSGHSDDYCSNYGSGYQAGWSSGSSSTSNSNSEGAAIGGNKINGDNNLINQQIIQQQGSGNGRHFNNDGNNNDGGNGQLPRCKILCLGVQ